MKLQPGWREQISGAQAPPTRLYVAPLDTPTAGGEVRVARTAVEGAALVERLRATPLSALALAATGAAHALAGAAWMPDGTVFAFVLDMRVDSLTAAAGELLRLPVPVIAHDVKPLLLGLWGAGLDPNFHTLTDTRLAAAALHLGEHHPRASGGSGESLPETIGRRQSLDAEHEHLLSLEGQCEHYGIAMPFPPGATADVRTLAARAIWTLHLYAAQQPDLVRHGLHAHLHTVEFPFAIANARMEWRGVHVDREQHKRLREGCARAQAQHAEPLRAHGIQQPGSVDAFLAEMKRAGLGQRIRSVDDGTLKRVEGLHPAIRAFRLHRRFGQLGGEAWEFDNQSRVHPEHRQLAAATGRNGCRRPNLAGIGRQLRPVVTAPPGRALLELDYSQVEVGVAAATYGDQALIDAYNSGDVYAAAAQRFYADDLSQAERLLAPEEFRSARPDLREQMKPFVLAVLYGGGAKTISAQFGITESAAAVQVARFLSLFPGLVAGMDLEVACGFGRGYSVTLSGLRRAIDRRAPGNWTRNVLRNTPVQGGAAVVFKKAIVDLDRAWRGTAVWLVLQIHDAVLIECPAGDIERVAERSVRIMEDALRCYFPVLRPRVSVNKSRPECWNKDGDAESLDRWLEESRA